MPGRRWLASARTTCRASSRCACPSDEGANANASRGSLSPVVVAVERHPGVDRFVRTAGRLGAIFVLAYSLPQFGSAGSAGPANRIDVYPGPGTLAAALS